MKVLGSRKQMWLQQLRMVAERYSESQLLEMLERMVEEYEDLTWDDILLSLPYSRKAIENLIKEDNAESGPKLPESRPVYNCLYGCPPSNFKH